MDQQTRPRGVNPDELFAEAAERLQAGESLEAVVASYPSAYQHALRDLLTIVVTAREIYDEAVPAIAPERRAARRNAFINAAAAFGAERAALARLNQTTQPLVPAASVDPLTTLRARFASLFALRAFRPAAAVLATVLLLLISNTLVTLAEAAVPGDVTYPVKQWIRNQQLYLAPVDTRPAVRKAQEEELVRDVQKAQVKADDQQRPIIEESVLLFHGYGKGYLDVGTLRVVAPYTPPTGQGEAVPMGITGELTPGSTVRIRYQIQPGEEDALGERVVQGIALEVIASEPVQPTPIPTETLLPPPTLTSPGATPPPCEVRSPPSGWGPYTFQFGDTLVAIAERTGVTVDELRTVNCLSTDYLLGGRNLLVPAVISSPTPTTGATLPELPTASATPLPPTTPTAGTDEPGAIETALATITAGPPFSVTIPAVTTPDLGLTPGPLPVITATTAISIPSPVLPTVEVPAATAIASATVTSEVTAEVTPAGVEGTPTAATTSEPTTGTVEGTPPTAETGEPATTETTTPATPEATSTATFTPLPGSEPTTSETPNANSTLEPTAEPTFEASPTSTPPEEVPTPTPTLSDGESNAPPTFVPTAEEGNPSGGNEEPAPPEPPTPTEPIPEPPPADNGNSSPVDSGSTENPPPSDQPAPPPEDSNPPPQESSPPRDANPPPADQPPADSPPEPTSES